ncbi:Short-chain dehydrogenase [Vannielia litorea]|uniref:Short-chain dehydrogenase n=1 Tax=Vannielia litorea TaxID=1217970 RepID=A0A1N6G1S0_9RHOB|nr:Short-chain dehydrogenase [Vannielia litorea]
MIRRALVTGGNRGIGYAIAEGLIALGHEVVIGCRDEAAGEAAADALGADLFVMDLREPDDMLSLLQGEPFDILVNNAGVLPQGSLFENPEGFFEAMEVMVHAPFLLMRALVPGMALRGWGRIVNLSSGYGSFAQGMQGPNGYGVAKAALNALTCVLPRDLPPHVKVNAMDPGWVNTRMGGAEAPTTPAQAAETAIWLATLSEDGPTGGFFRRKLPIAW